MCIKKKSINCLRTKKRGEQRLQSLMFIFELIFTLLNFVFNFTFINLIRCVKLNRIGENVT